MWNRHDAMMLGKINGEPDLEYSAGDAEEKISLKSQDNIDMKVLPESITDMKDDNDFISAPHTRCLSCSRMQEPSYRGLCCDDCFRKMLLKNVAPTKKTSQHDQNHASSKPKRSQPKRNVFAQLSETTSDTDRDRNKIDQVSMRGKTKKIKTNKQERKDISANYSDEFYSSERTHDGIDVRIKIRENEHAWKANISVDGRNHVHIGEIAKAQTNLPKKSKSEICSATIPIFSLRF